MTDRVDPVVGSRGKRTVIMDTSDSEMDLSDLVKFCCLIPMSPLEFQRFKIHMM